MAPSSNPIPAKPAVATSTPASGSATSTLDLAIIGSGPAALSAALYAARAGLRTTIFERSDLGGALSTIDQIDNYPGFSGSGRTLAEQMRDQALAAGAQFEYGECTNIAPGERGFTLTIDEEPVRAHAVLLATGSEPRPLDFSLEKPVSYCALCDSEFAKGKQIAVVGGGNSAVQEALLLAPLAQHLTLVTHSRLKAQTCLKNQLKSQPNVTILESTEPTPSLLNQFDQIFVFIGQRPAISCLGNLELPLDPSGYVKTGPSTQSTAPSVQPTASADRSPFPHETPVPGLFVAGDLRSGALRQVVTAAADGATAAVEIAQFFREI